MFLEGAGFCVDCGGITCGNCNAAVIIGDGCSASA